MKRLVLLAIEGEPSNISAVDAAGKPLAICANVTWPDDALADDWPELDLERRRAMYRWHDLVLLPAILEIRKFMRADTAKEIDSWSDVPPSRREYLKSTFPETAA